MRVVQVGWYSVNATCANAPGGIQAHCRLGGRLQLVRFPKAWRFLNLVLRGRDEHARQPSSVGLPQVRGALPDCYTVAERGGGATGRLDRENEANRLSSACPLTCGVAG